MTKKSVLVGHRVRFTSDYDHRPTSGTTIAYRKGWSGTVRRECAARAVALGKAEYVAVTDTPSGIAATIGKKQRAKRSAGNAQAVDD